MKKLIIATTAALGLSLSAASAAVVTETFNTMGGSGTAVNTFAGGTVTTNSNGSYDQAIIFDTNDSVNTDDGDLEAPVTRKSSGVVEELGNILIITENAGPAFLPADDENKGGKIAFNFDDLSTVFSLDFVDTGEGDVTVSFFDIPVDVFGALPAAIATFTVDLDLDTGNNLPNFFDTFFFGKTGVEGVKAMVVDFGTNSGAIDNLVYQPVPVPAALPFMLTGLAGFAVARRRKARA